MAARDRRDARRVRRRPLALKRARNQPGERGDGDAGRGVEDEVVPRRDDHEQHEDGVDRAGNPGRGAAAEPDERSADDDRVADVHARDRGIGVVERADEAVVQVDVTARDRVEDAEAREPRRGGREDEEADERDPAREQQRRADERKRGRPPPVEPEQHRAGHCQVQADVRDAEGVDEPGERAGRALDPLLDEDVERPLERRHLVRVPLGSVAVACDEPARGLVGAVEDEHGERLRPERVPGREPRTYGRPAPGMFPGLRPRGGSRYRAHG